MFRIRDWATPHSADSSRRSARALVAYLAVAGFLLPSLARAATLTVDFVVPTGNYDSSLDVFPDDATVNWLDDTQPVPAGFPVLTPPSANPLSIPGTDDDAFVRNGGTVTVTTAITNRSFNVGVPHTIFTDDGISAVIQTETGGNGTVNMTGGSISGPIDTTNADTTLRRYGTQIILGGTGSSTAVPASQTFTGVFTQSAGKINLSVGDTTSGGAARSSSLVVGAGTATSTPTSLFTLSGTGEIGMVYAVGGNRGINVRNGTFNMTGGKIYNEEAVDVGAYNQQFMQVASTSGSANGPYAVGTVGHAVATANFSGTAVVDVHHGIRVAPNARAEGFVTISGNANLKLGNNVELATSGGTVNSVDAAYAQLDMSGGYLQVGQATPLAGNSNYSKNIIVGSDGRGVFTQTGGTVVVGNSLDMSNQSLASALFTMKDPAGGPTGVPFSFTTKSVNTRVGVANLALLTPTDSDFIIDSPDATFTQSNYTHPSLSTPQTGQTRIGSNGKSTFEIRQGKVLLGQTTIAGGSGGTVDLSNTANARATLNLKGGKLSIGGNVIRTDFSAASVPVVNLTGGILEFNTFNTTTMNWQTNLTLDSSGPGVGVKLVTRQGVTSALAQGVVNVGDATHPGNFLMKAGSSWDIDIFGHAVDNADRIVVGTGGTGAIDGGTLNLNYIISGPYTGPSFGDSIRIVTTTTGLPTLNSAAINIVAPPSPLGYWTTQVVPIGVNGSTTNSIRLVFVPEPTSCALAIMGLMVGIAGIRRRS